MLEWQLHEKHELEVKKLFKEFGFLSADGKRVVKFSGVKFWPAFEALHHSATAFDECDCKRTATDRDNPNRRMIRL